MLPHDIARCRAELPSTATPEMPIRCSKRNECEYHTAPGGEWTPSVAWRCDGNRFDQFRPVRPVTG